MASTKRKSKARPAQRSIRGHRISTGPLKKRLKKLLSDLKKVPARERGKLYTDTVTSAMKLDGSLRCRLGMTFSTWTNE